MARRFSLGRIIQRVRNIVAPSPPPPPKREPPPRERPSRDPFKAEWKRLRGKGNYRGNLKAFHKIVDRVESDPDEQVILWESFVTHIVKGEGRFRRNSNQNMFWRDSGIDPRDFDWKIWREAMGYTGKRRSRTP
jgi:hypothetical protein